MTREEAINKWVVPAIKNTWNEKKCTEIINALKKEPKTGHWYYDEERGATGIYAICSNCDEEIYQTGDFKFCPNCGAKME